MSHPRPQGVPAPAPPPGYPAPAVYPGGHLPPSGSVPHAYSAPPAGYPAPHGYSAPQGYAAPPAGYPVPHECATPHGARRFHIVLRKHTGLMVMWINHGYRFTGTFEECQRAYRAAQTHNLLAGWWGVVSLLVMNWVTMLLNWTAMRDLRRLAAQPPGPYGQL
ncbi:MAG: hypothetical protein JOZ49_04105 [Mycolicibacterium sp.]|nr:hypothetical protein [Mycolicibacterium sp.]